jgi:hypothetical protein
MFFAVIGTAFALARLCLKPPPGGWPGSPLDAVLYGAAASAAVLFIACYKWPTAQRLFGAGANVLIVVVLSMGAVEQRRQTSWSGWLLLVVIAAALFGLPAYCMLRGTGDSKS